MHDFSELNGVCALEHLGVIRVHGEDAAKFIHGQLTNDFLLLDTAHARLAAFCSSKGRMQASFIAFKTASDEILLICSKDLLPATLKRLSMFVMRAKAKLVDASVDYSLFGLAGPSTLSNQAVAHEPWLRFEAAGGYAITLYPAGAVSRQLLVLPNGVIAPNGPDLATDLWAWGEIHSGIATVAQPTFEAFVPQMLNYESVGGVNFKKGCYPGQEVVARSQFRGTLKRRAFIVRSQGPMAAGDEIFASDDDTQPVGLVVQTAKSPHGGWDAIVSMQISAAAGATLHLGTATRADLHVLPLPYALLEDV